MPAFLRFLRHFLLGASFVTLSVLAFREIPQSGPWRPAAITAAGLLAAMGLLGMISAFGRRGGNRAFLRLDHFLPFLRAKRRPPGKDSLLTRAARRMLPSTFFFDPKTGRQGLVRRVLQKLGPTVVSAPGRRAVQGICFVAFLVLFFYVCWPYSARPEAPGMSIRGLTLARFDQATSAAVLTGEEAGGLRPGQRWHLVNPSLQRSAGLFVIENAGPPVELLPVQPLGPDQLDVFLLGAGPWELQEKEPGRWPSHYTDGLANREIIPAESFLIIDPLVSLSTAVASRSWVWSLVSAAVILIACILIPRGFCGYLCPLGTLIDLFDWAVSKRVKRFRVSGSGWWVHLKYYLLAAVMTCAVFGVLISGFVAAIPVITRGMLFLGEPLQSGLSRGWHAVPPMNAGHFVSIGLFLGVLLLGLLKPRFWCKYVCPSGAVFSLGNLFRVTERKVESSCINCNKCVEICPFDAIKPDFTTRGTDCTLCQTCGGVCPSHAIKFVERWNFANLKPKNDPPTGETALGRRGFVSLVAGLTGALAGGVGAAFGIQARGARLKEPDAVLPVRPPGSVPEAEFLQMCIRCGECFKACPNNVLQPLGFEQGLEGLWTPFVKADWAGCESSCNACGQVCPTGAIRALPLEEKKAARMGLAVVNLDTCLPYAGKEACQLCVDECHAAGYHAIEFTQVHTKVDGDGNPIPDSGFLAPAVLADQCVGCGLCQTRCYNIHVKGNHHFPVSAIVVEAGEGKEDRLMEGSYVELRREEAAARQAAPAGNEGGYFVPGLKTPAGSDPDPFGPL